MSTKPAALAILALSATLSRAIQVQHHHMRAGMLQASSQAWSLLSRTMEFDRFTACRGVIERRDTLCSGSVMRIWAEQSGDGKLKLSVLGPLSQQGITSVDDGQQWITYHPDCNQVFVQPSPRLNSASTEGRINIAKRNYTLEVSNHHHKVAGRKVYCLVAIPKHPEMPARRYCIDEQKPFLLRMEVVGKDGGKVMLDTKQIEFPEAVPEKEFVLQAAKLAKLVPLREPSRTALGKRAKRAVGFSPAIPSALPFGFVVQHPEVTGSGSKKILAVRITDGLVNATVYEWDNKRNPQQCLGGDCSHDRAAKGIGMRVVGEMPELVLVKLLDTFIREALKSAGPYLALSQPETLKLCETLNLEQNSCGEDRNYTEIQPILITDEYIYALVEIEE